MREEKGKREWRFGKSSQVNGSPRTGVLILDQWEGRMMTGGFFGLMTTLNDFSICFINTAHPNLLRWGILTTFWRLCFARWLLRWNGWTRNPWVMHTKKPRYGGRRVQASTEIDNGHGSLTSVKSQCHELKNYSPRFAPLCWDLWHKKNQSR